jgi:hypothetical protein
VDVHIYPFYLLFVLLVWLLVYHVAFWAVALIRNPSLVCWSLGPFGITIVALRQPSLPRLAAQLVTAAVALGCTDYASLSLLMPAPVVGLGRDTSFRALAIALPIVALSAIHIFGAVRARLHPLWGEARVMSGVQRSVATGAHVYFTPMGRAFLRERFGATPAEFLRMVRY